MLSERLIKTKRVNVLGHDVELKKLPVRFREWAALRMYELRDGQAVVRSYDDLLAVHMQTLLHGVRAWPWGEVDEATAREIATQAPELAEAILREIERFCLLDDEEAEKKEEGGA